MIGLGRILAAGVLGGMAIMVVAFALHRPPLDDVGWANLPGDAQIRATLSSGIGQSSGLYVFPALVGLADDDGAMKAHDKAVETGPSGFVLYRRAGDAVDPARAMPEELLKTLLMATLAALLLAQTAAPSGYLFRFGFVATIGAMVSVSTHVSDHAWFGFPGDYIMARIALDLIPWVVASLIIAALVRPRASDALPVPG